MSERKLTKTECHVFDLDAIKILIGISKLKNTTNLSSSEIENIDRFEESYKHQLDFFSEDQNLDWHAHHESNHPLIIPSSHNFYHIFLARTLALYDINKIRQFLNYQLINFEGNYYAPEQNKFPGLIEFIVYPAIQNFPLNTIQVLSQLSTWIDDQRPFVVFRDPSTILKIEEQYQSEVLNILNSYFSEENFIKLKQLFSGEPISGKIIFLGDAIQLLDFFKDLKKSKILNYSYKQIENWACNFFQYKTSDKILPIKKRYAHEILAKNLKPCKHPIKKLESLPKIMGA